MGSFGERLQREREMRGITLDEIAEATKIGTRSLRALESQEFEKLPGGIFNKGFVRSYARFLGIDEEQAVADYEAAAKEKLAAKGAKAFPAPRVEQEDMTEEERAAVDRSRRTGMVVVLLAAAAFVLAYFLWTHYAHVVNPGGPQGSPSPSESAPSPPAPSPSAPSEPAPSEPASVPPALKSEPGTPKGSIQRAPVPKSAPAAGAAREIPSEAKPATGGPVPAPEGSTSQEPTQAPAGN